MSIQKVSFLRNEELRLLLFGGKGGVGKTTTAAATSLYWANRRPAREVLIVSTDPAHSLSDSFCQFIGDEITPISGVSNLYALELDAARRLEDFKQEHGGVLQTIADRGTYFDREDIAAFFDLSLPGLDELMAVIEVARFIRKGVYDLVILDTAPTGHTLRLLALPQLMERWIHVLDLMMEKHRYMASIFGRYRPDEADAFLEEMLAELDDLRRLLADGNAAEFVPLTVPEAMGIEETTRLLESLTDFGIPVRTVVVNRMVAQLGCPYCEARHRLQIRYLEEARRRFSEYNLVWVPLMPQEVQGQAALENYLQALTEHNPMSTPPGKSPPPHSCAKPEETDGEMQEPLGLAQRYLILFGGKGGVGKTTLSAATALYLARQEMGHRVLLFSVDPAHSLSDSLDQTIGNQVTPVSGVDGLFAIEMDPVELVADLREQYAAAIDEVFDGFLGRSFDAPYDRQVMEELVYLSPPGLDELMALMRIMDFVDEGAFDRYVLDLAPTGHALRFLETPFLVRQWFVAFFKLLLKYQGVVSLSQVADLLREKSKQLRRVTEVLTDGGQCEFIAVTIPEEMAVRETARLLRRMAELSVSCHRIIANMIVPPNTCAFCAAVRRDQRPHLEELRAFDPGFVRVPLFPGEIRGIAGLDKIAGLVYGDGNG